MGFGSATYMLEQLGKAFNELVSRKDDLEDMVQWKDIEEHFHDLQKSLMKRFDELEEKEKAFVKKELETHAFLAERDAVVAAKEQASLDQMQQIKDAAVLAIVEAHKSCKPTSQNPDDAGDSAKNKCIFMGSSALCSSGEGNGGGESKGEVPSQKQNYADRVPGLDAAEAPESSTEDSGMLTSSSQSASHCKFDLSGHCNSKGSLANDQLMSCDANGDFAGLRKENAVIFNLPQHPTLPNFHAKVKVEYPDNDLIGPESVIASHVSGSPELNISEVPQSGLAESGGLPWCSEHSSGWQSDVLSVDFNRRGVQGTDCICSNQMTACNVKDDSFGLKNVSVYKHNLPHCSTLSSFPIKVKVENCEVDPLHAFRDGTDDQSRVPELYAADIFESGVSVDSGTVSKHSKINWGCGYGNLLGDHNSGGTQANGSIQSNQLISSDANGDLVGPGNVDSCFSKTQLSTFPIKVKVEHSDSSLRSQYGGAISGHGDKGHKPDSAKVSGGGNGTTGDSCLVTQCTQNATNCQYRGLSGDLSMPGTAEIDNTCLNRITACEAKGDFVGLRELDINSRNLSQLPTLTAFPVKVKVEYSDDKLIGSQEEGINSHIDGYPELNASPCSQNASECQYDSMPLDCSRQRIQAIDSTFSNQMTTHQAQPDANGLENLHPYPALSTSHIRVKVESLDNDLMGQFRDGLNGSFGMDPPAAKVKSERTDDLDHIPLKERQNMLLSRHSSVATVAGLDRFGLLEGTSPREPASLMEDSNQHIAGNLKDDGYSIDVLSSMAGSHSDVIIETKKSEILSTSRFGSSSGAIAGVSGTVPLDSPNDIKCGLNLSPNNLHLGHEGDGKWSSEITSAEYKAHGDQDFVDVDANMLALSSSSFTGDMKLNIMENGSECPCLASLGPASNYNMIAMEDDQEIPHESYEDEIDHMILQDRIKLLISRKVSKLDCSRNLKCSRKTVPSVADHYPTVSENSEPRIIKIRRKRKKTVTDSVETALEEDAPGLLQVLVDKGIVVDEIKLYGGMEEENSLDDSANMDNFGELEDVISKVFSQKSSLLKFAPIHCTKGSKASYCLACLISLVEQTRYLQFRKWPVEWGWCRDLQSFIFIFERHNRIVLERPEYGYATYFFELVDSLPINWQIRRLVTAMKLSSCSRITIIENRSLLVGKDLTEGEARVLEEYGWAPNTGLGSMLNYCDRVVHDRKNEKDGSEWRSKIGKLLMDGYNGGTIVLPKLPKKAIEYKSTLSHQVMEYMDTQSPKVAECKVNQNPLFIEHRSNRSSHFMKYEGTQSPNIKLEFS